MFLSYLIWTVSRWSIFCYFNRSSVYIVCLGEIHITYSFFFLLYIVHLAYITLFIASGEDNTDFEGGALYYGPGVTIFKVNWWTWSWTKKCMPWWMNWFWIYSLDQPGARRGWAPGNSYTKLSVCKSRVGLYRGGTHIRANIGK